MIEWLAPGFLYAIVKDTFGALRRRHRRLSPAQILELRQKWKPLFEEEIMKNHTQKLRKDIIIRDVKRMDDYPNVDEKKKGISPWFRVGLMGTYHKGILVGLRWGKLTSHGENAWKLTDYKSQSGDIKVILIGKIPFESIESVDWKGDEYYYFPHIYCYFDTKNKEPYEDLTFCEQRCNPGWPPFYVDVAPYEEARRLSKKLGLELSF
jgi:hypothetical protein